jgi:hypothetical protein
MKAFLILNKHVSASNYPLLEGVFWKRKHARAYARQLIRKTGALNYKFLYSIVTYEFEQKPFTDYNKTTSRNPFVVVLHTLIKQPG